MPYVKNTILRQRYDITPWKMKEWREQGIPGIGLRESDADVVHDLIGGRTAQYRGITPTSRPSVPYKEAAARLGVKIGTLVNRKSKGRLSGPSGAIWEDELPDFQGRPSMTYAQAAEEWQVSVATVREWKALGLIDGPLRRVWTNEDKPDTSRKKGAPRSAKAAMTEMSMRGESGYRSYHNASPGFRPYRD